MNLKSKIAITWSNGFVGSYAVKHFSQEHEIIAFQRQKYEIQKNITYKKWDLCEKYDGRFDCDIFIHAAADTGYDKSREEMIEQNILSNKNVLEIVNNSHCKHFIYISSSSIYQWISWIIDESVKIDEKNLKNSYSFTKYWAENYIKENLNKNIKLTILRPRAIYWEWDRVLEPNILKHQIFWKLILLWNGKNITSLTSIENFIQAIDTVIKKQTTKFEIFNISDDNAKTIEEIYNWIVLKYKLNWIIKIPFIILKIFYFLNPNKITYLLDNFWFDKILDIWKFKKII